VIAHLVDGVRRFAARAGDACIVEEDYVTPCAARPSQADPSCQGAAEVLKEDERRSTFRAEAPVCVTDSASFDQPGWSRDVGILCHLDVLSLAVGCIFMITVAKLVKRVVLRREVRSLLGLSLLLRSVCGTPKRARIDTIG